MQFIRRNGKNACLFVFLQLILLSTVSRVNCAETGSDNIVSNGGFESGVKGWMYHQWTGKKVPGYVDGADVYEGKAAFKMTDKTNSKGRYFAKEIKLNGAAGKDYVLLFALKTTGMEPGTARVRFSIEGSGWFRSNGSMDIVSVGGTQDWKIYGFLIPEKLVKGKKKATVFFYHDRLNKGILGIDALSFRPGSEDDIPAGAVPTQITGATSRPSLNTFKYGEPVKLDFKAEGLIPNGVPLILNLKIVDEHDKLVKEQQATVAADDKGRWRGFVEAPAGKLGFYRVYASLSNGVSLKASGSRKAGFLTYAVVPDPKLRKDYGETASRFGMQGGFGPWKDDVLSYLGARWVLDDRFKWRRLESKPEKKFTADAALKKWKPIRSAGWKTYSLPTLYEVPKWATKPETFSYCTGTLTPDGEKEWVRFCKEAVAAYAALNPQNEKNIYQITWEPIQPWGFKGTNADLTRVYELAYNVIHDTDPKAVVAGPCRGADKNEVQRTNALLKTGLSKYLDAYTVHPYFSKHPESEGMVNQLRLMREVLQDNLGRDIPMYGTEQGLSTHENPQEDLEHAQVLMRQNLITLGEGFQFNMAFFVVDYRLAGQKGYGYYYNLVNGVPWGPSKASPRPVVPAYAAQSLLLDGSGSLGAIEWLGKGILGYAFEREGVITLALWNYGSFTGNTDIPVGISPVRVYDWMGNQAMVDAPEGIANLKLTAEPVYIVGVSQKLWGKNNRDTLKILTPEVVVSDESPAVVKCQVKATSNAINGELLFIPDSQMKMKATTVPVAVSLGEVKDVTFKIDSNIQKDLVSGAYPLQVMLREKGMVTAIKAANMQLVAPIKIEEVKVVDPRQVNLILRNESRIKQKGTAVVKLQQILKGEPRPDLPMIDLPEGKVQLIDVVDSELKTSFVLAPAERKEITLSFNQIPLHPFHTYRLTAEVNAGNSRAASYNKNVNFFVANRIAKPVTVDGKLSDWAEIPPVILTGRDFINRSLNKYTGDNDLSAEVRLAWDASALYMAFKIRDDKWCQLDKDAMIWRGDCVQIATDVSNMMNSAMPLHTEFTLTLSSTGPQAYRHISFDPAKLVLGNIGNEIKFTVVKQDHGLLYEASVSWKSLGSSKSPKVGDMMKIACSINDRDDKSQNDPTALGIFDGIAPNKDPDLFGTVILGK